MLLVVLRCAQGIGVGGEWGGAVLMAVEHSPRGRRGLSGSWPQMGVPAGLFLSTVVFAICSTQMSDEQFLAWGWRLPFLVSVALVAVGIFIRLAIIETPAFTSLERSRANARRGRWSPRCARTAAACCSRWACGVAENGLFYVYTVFVLSYGPAELGLERNTMLTGVTLGGARPGSSPSRCTARCRTASAARPVYLFGAAFSLLYAFPFFLLLETRSASVVWLAIVVGVAVGHNAMYGPQAAYFSELFGASVRYSGASIAYQLASVVSGGLAPFIATALLAWQGKEAVAAYMMALATITLVSTYLADETYRNEV